MNRSWLQVVTMFVVSCLLVVGCTSESKGLIEKSQSTDDYA